MDVETLKIEAQDAGPFVTVLTVSGPVDESAERALREQFAQREPVSHNVVVDLTDAVLYDSWPFPLLADQADRLEENNGRLVIVSGSNPTVKPFVGEPSLPGLVWFESLDDAMVELLGDMAKLGDWPPRDGDGRP
jgi:anti-anti-sigma regulatory factor